MGDGHCNSTICQTVLRLTERSINGAVIPEFTLVKYKFGDETNDVVAGGILQFEAVIGATAEEVQGMETKLKQSFGLPENAPFRLAAVPIKSSQVALYAPAGNLVSSSFGSGVAPNDATQKMVFQLDLTEVGVNVYTALTASQGGVPVVVTLDYYGLTPAATVKITANYRKIAQNYSSNTKTKTAASATSFWGGESVRKRAR